MWLETHVQSDSQRLAGENIVTNGRMVPLFEWNSQSIADVWHSIISPLAMLLVGTDQLWMAPGFKTYQNPRKNMRMAIQEFISWENCVYNHLIQMFWNFVFRITAIWHFFGASS